MLLYEYNWLECTKNLTNNATRFCKNSIEKKHPIITLPIKILKFFELLAGSIVVAPFIYACNLILKAIDGFQSTISFILNFLTNNALDNNLKQNFVESVLDYWKLCGKSLYEYLTDKNDARLAIKIPVVFLGCSLLLLSVLLETVRLVLKDPIALVFTACFAPYLATIALFYGPIYLVDNCAEKFKAQSNKQSSIDDDDDYDYDEPFLIL